MVTETLTYEQTIKSVKKVALSNTLHTMLCPIRKKLGDDAVISIDLVSDDQINISIHHDRDVYRLG